MITVTIASSFVAERSYAVDVVLGEFLGLEHRTRISQDPDYKIILENGNRITIRDHFFSRFSESAGYLHVRNVPNRVALYNNPFAIEKTVPVIYGDNELNVRQSEIVCGVDIFSSTFFMLTRWEEYKHPVRDAHGRFPAGSSVAYKNSFLLRPVVNEYVELLWNMLLYLGWNGKRRDRKFRVLLSYDIDKPLVTPLGLPILWMKAQVQRHRGSHVRNAGDEPRISSSRPPIVTRRDIISTYDWILDQSERIGAAAAFFLKANHRAAKFDRKYSLQSRWVQRLVELVVERKQEIGFHPGYYTADHRERWFEEWKRFRDHFSHLPVEGGRQHFLRFEVPLTWRFWEEAGCLYESSLCFADYVGFRCGVCYEYPVFDVEKRQRMMVRERPLLAMDKTLWKESYMGLSEERTIGLVDDLRAKVRRHSGDFTFLWHPNSLVGGRSRRLFLACMG